MTSTESKFYIKDSDDALGNYENVEFNMEKKKTRHLSLGANEGSQGASNHAVIPSKNNEKPPKIPSKIKITFGNVGEKTRPKSVSLRNSYDPVTVNFGKPVIRSSSPTSNDDFFGNITFQSPISDLTRDEKESLLTASAPVPAPRTSKQQRPLEQMGILHGSIPESDTVKSFSEDDDIYENISEENFSDSPKTQDGTDSIDPPSLPERNTPLGSEALARVSRHSYENVYCEVTPNCITKEAQNIMDRDVDVPVLKFKVENSPKEMKKSETIDIRQTISRWYEEAEEEITRDLSLDLSALEEMVSSPKTITKNQNQYEHIALTDENGSKFTLVNGKAIKIGKGTLFRDFDPCFTNETLSTEAKLLDEDCTSSSSPSDDSEVEAEVFTYPKKRLSAKSNASGSTRGSFLGVNKDPNRNSSASSVDLPPPAITPPPPPKASPPSPPPRATNPQVLSYERVWVAPLEDDSNSAKYSTSFSTLSTPSSKYKKLKPHHHPGSSMDRAESQLSINSSDSHTPSEASDKSSSTRLNSSINSQTHSDITDPKHVRYPLRSRSSSKTSKHQEEGEVDSLESDGWRCFENPPSGEEWSDNDSKCSDFDGTSSGILKQPSFLRKSISSLNISKIATSIKKKMTDQVIMRSVIDSRPATAIHLRKSTITEGANKLGSKHHSGVLLLYSKIKRSFQSKWCILGNGNFRYFNDKDSLAIPKSMIILSNVLSIRKHDFPTVSGTNEDQQPLYTFDLVYSIAPGKHVMKSFSASSEAERETWVVKIAQSLSFRLETIELDNFGYILWANLKTGFAGKWEKSWIMGSKQCRLLRYTAADLGSVDELDLKRVKNLTFVKNSKNLSALDSTLPVLVLDATDRSLYFQIENEKECQVLQEFIESVSFSSTNALKDQQLTQDGIPVIVDKCIGFVYSHGCLTEGIYRLSGVNTKINKLLTELSQNAWNVHISRESYSEHDVANALKRFMRTLDEPLLTQKLKSEWLRNSGTEDPEAKFNGYRQLIGRLPTINYLTLRRLIGHLHAVAEKSSRNLMPNYNLAALWGPTLLTVDSSETAGFSSAESEVCKDLIDLYEGLFNVDKMELERERKITEVLEKLIFHEQGGSSVKRSGDLRMWVYLGTRSAGRSVCVVVHPNMTAIEMTNFVKKEANEEENKDWVLHEVVLGGELERPIHHSETILEVTLKWGTWADHDRRDNYLLLKANTFYEEALALAIPPLTFFGDAFYLDNKPRSSFKPFQFSIHNARLSVCREGKSRHAIGGNNSIAEVGAWNIEEIFWYFGCEAKKKPPFNMNVSFIDRGKPVDRTKEQPNFGRVISFESRDNFLKFVASMMVAEHSNNLVPNTPLLHID